MNILFSIFNLIHIALHWSTQSEINSNEVYCKIYFGLYWIIAGIGCITLILLTGIRYLGICKGYVTTKLMAIKILVLSLLTLIILVITISILSGPNPNQGYLFCSVNYKSNVAAKIIELTISILLFLFVVVYIICYFNIGRVYYKNIISVEVSVIETNSIETRRQGQMHGNYGNMESNNLRNNNQNSTQAFKSKFQVIKLITMSKILSMIIIYSIEIIPISAVLIFNYFIETRDYEQIENICYWIAEFITVTNTLMIILLHRETWEEFYKLITRK
jgi:hypothetical protein